MSLSVGHLPTWPLASSERVREGAGQRAGRRGTSYGETVSCKLITVPLATVSAMFCGRKQVFPRGDDIREGAGSRRRVLGVSL